MEAVTSKGAVKFLDESRIVSNSKELRVAKVESIKQDSGFHVHYKAVHTKECSKCGRVFMSTEGRVATSYRLHMKKCMG